jgi:hypothetical protein
VGEMTKWPRLVVVPEKGHETVTREQASEILLRTDGSYFAVNDREWPKLCADLLGIPSEWKPYPDGGGWWHIPWQGVMAWQESIGALELHYVANSRIMSAWIGGPHGWCDWDGRIGCGTWNIGKWPTAEEVTEDWQKIAAAFPYLDLRAQCIADEGDGDVAAQWRVTGGKAALVEPIGRLAPPEDLGEADMLLRLFGRDGERGVSLERLTEAMEHVKAGGSRGDA